MATVLLGLNPGLSAGSRLPLTRPARSVSVLELACLLGLGVLAASAAVFLRLRLGVPGHAILRTVLPVALGLSLVPRHLAGSVIATTAFVTALGFQAYGVRGVGVPALTSLLLTGPLLDLALLGARPGWRLYGRLALAGLVSNLLALASRPTLLLLGIHLGGGGGGGGGGGRSEELDWVVVCSYAVCGLAAGLVSALCWFRLRAGRKETAT
jgi:hypothetical protein